MDRLLCPRHGAWRLGHNRTGKHSRPPTVEGMVDDVVNLAGQAGLHFTEERGQGGRQDVPVWRGGGFCE